MDWSTIRNNREENYKHIFWLTLVIFSTGRSDTCVQSDNITSSMDKASNWIPNSYNIIWNGNKKKINLAIWPPLIQILWLFVYSAATIFGVRFIKLYNKFTTRFSYPFMPFIEPNRTECHKKIPRGHNNVERKRFPLVCWISQPVVFSFHFVEIFVSESFQRFTW